MQIVLISQGLSQYISDYEAGSIVYPVPGNCPQHNCGAHDSFYGHGSYHRSACELFSRDWHSIAIRRLRCKYCGATISFLPSFLIPYFQFSIIAITGALLDCFNSQLSSNSLLRFHKRRWLKSVNNLIVALRSIKPTIAFDFDSDTKKAISILYELFAPPGYKAHALIQAIRIHLMAR